MDGVQLTHETVWIKTPEVSKCAVCAPPPVGPSVTSQSVLGVRSGGMSHPELPSLNWQLPSPDMSLIITIISTWHVTNNGMIVTPYIVCVSWYCYNQWDNCDNKYWREEAISKSLDNNHFIHDGYE